MIPSFRAVHTSHQTLVVLMDNSSSLRAKFFFPIDGRAKEGLFGKKFLVQKKGKVPSHPIHQNNDPTFDERHCRKGWIIVLTKFDSKGPLLCHSFHWTKKFFPFSITCSNIFRLRFVHCIHFLFFFFLFFSLFRSLPISFLSVLLPFLSLQW